MTQPTQQPTACSSTLLKILLAISFAACLALAPSPALAQHGGGGGSSGGGGGSHGGGGGGGGSSHGGGPSSGGHASSGSHVSTGSHGTTVGAGGNPANPNGGGHWWNPFHGNTSSESVRGGANSAAAKDSNAAKATNPPRFAAGNNTWQDPPARARTNVASNHFSASNHGATLTKRPSNSMRNAPREEFRFRHHRPPVVIFDPFFFSPFGFGFGFGCDPFWGWGCSRFAFGPGFGFGAGFGYGADFGYGGFGNGWDLGYYNGGGYGGSDMTFNALGPSSAPDDVPSLEGNSGDWQDAPANNSQATDASGNNLNAQLYVVIVLRDGSSYAVSDYWLAGGKLHYITSYGGENSVDVNQLDLQRTVNDNATRGIEFTLRPTPAANVPNDLPVPQPAPPADSRPQTSAPNPQ